MTPQQLTEWRKRLGFNKLEAADALGLSYGAYCNYERGFRQGKRHGKRSRATPIPKAVELACVAIALGIKIAHLELLLKSQLDSGNRIANLPAHKLNTTTR